MEHTSGRCMESVGDASRPLSSRNQKRKVDRVLNSQQLSFSIFKISSQTPRTSRRAARTPTRWRLSMIFPLRMRRHRRGARRFIQARPPGSRRHRRSWMRPGSSACAAPRVASVCRTRPSRAAPGTMRRCSPRARRAERHDICAQRTRLA